MPGGYGDAMQEQGGAGKSQGGGPSARAGGGGGAAVGSGQGKAGPAYRSAEAVPAGKRRKFTGVEGDGVNAVRRLLAGFPDAAAALTGGLRFPELPALQQFVDLERAVDDMLWQKKMDVQEALKGGNTWTPRTLRIFVTSSPSTTGQDGPHTSEAGSPNNPGSPQRHAWTMRVFARLLEGSGEDDSMLRESGQDGGGGAGSERDPGAKPKELGLAEVMMSHVKRIEVDTGSASGAEGAQAKVVWTPHPPDLGKVIPAKKDSGAEAASEEEKRGSVAGEKVGERGLEGGVLVVSGEGDKDFVAQVTVEVKHGPERFQVAQELQALLGVELETRARILQTFWQYVKTNKLQDSTDPSYIVCNDALQKLFHEQRIKITSLSSRVQPFLRPPPPITIRHRVRVGPGSGAEAVGEEDVVSTVDATVDTVSPADAERVGFLAGLEASQREIRAADENLAHEVAQIEERQKRRAFLLAFARSPVHFINAVVASQSTDIGAIMAAPYGAHRQHQRSGLFALPWAEDAVLKYLQRQMVSEGGNA